MMKGIEKETLQRPLANPLKETSENHLSRNTQMILFEESNRLEW